MNQYRVKVTKGKTVGYVVDRNTIQYNMRQTKTTLHRFGIAYELAAYYRDLGWSTLVIPFN